MSENVQKTLAEASEVQEAAARGNRLVALAAAIIAVLAALGTLTSHHSSIAALTLKNQAILTQARASDAYTKSEARDVRAEVYEALIAAGAWHTDQDRKTLSEAATRARGTSQIFTRRAQVLEESSTRDDDRSEQLLRSYETLEIATAFFEISIVLVSISALASTRVFLTLGCGLSAIGIGFFIFGLLQGH